MTRLVIGRDIAIPSILGIQLFAFLDIFTQDIVHVVPRGSRQDLPLETNSIQRLFAILSQSSILLHTALSIDPPTQILILATTLSLNLVARRDIPIPLSTILFLQTHTYV